MNNLQPHEGQWYAVRNNGQFFCVINVDTEHEVIDIQDFDGDIDELDFEEWEGLDLEAAAAPDDEEGALDGNDDIGADADETRRSDWAEPLRVRRINGDDWPESDDDDARPAPRVPHQ